jgi:Tol biopolymer transport system component
LLYVPTAGGNLIAQAVDLPAGRLSGQPVEIGRTRISETFGRYVMSTAPTGVIATLGSPVGIGQFTWMSRDGRVLETIGEPSIQLGVELSPDGQQLATFRSEGIWTMNLSRPVPNRVTPASYRHPIWSPDGTKILSLFQGRGIGTFDLVLTSLTTGRTESWLESTAGLFKPMSWSRDGRTIVFIQPDKGRSPVIWKMPADSPQKASVYLENAQIFEARLSPDGQWMAYATDRSGRFEIEVRSFPTPGPAFAVSTEGGGFPRWRADGRELYYLSANARLTAATFTPGAPPSIGRAAPLFEVRLVSHPDRGSFAASEYDVNSDGSRFLVNRLVSPPETSLTIIANWSPPR